MANLVVPKQHLLNPVLFGGSYWKKVINIDASNLIGYWPLDDNLITPCPYFDGSNDFNNIDTAGLVADFDGQEGTFS